MERFKRLPTLRIDTAERRHLKYRGKTYTGFAGDTVATALYAKPSGLKCISLLLPQPNARSVRRNLLAGFSSGVELHHFERRQ